MILQFTTHELIECDACLTLLEWAEWTMANAGASGKTDAAIVIERAAKEAGI